MQMKISLEFHTSGKHTATMNFIVMTLLISCASLSCQRANPSASGAVKRFDFKGKVVSVDKAKKEITVAHDEIKGYMPAMTMPFPLKDEWAFDVLAPGSTVGATLVVDADGYWLEGIVVSSAGNDTINSGQADRSPEKAIGQVIPTFNLVNQDGKQINPQKYRGKVLLLTFIYTRCPLPKFCELMSTNFAELDKQFAADQKLQDATHLLSITIDPAYDTPKVLRSYGAAYTGKYTEEKFGHWEFATGKPDEIKRIAEFFGLTYFEEKQQITHSLRTAIISPDGKVVKVYDGNDWNPSDVFADVQSILGK
jgi:protein SCO1